MQLWGWWDCRKCRCDPEGDVQASTYHLKRLFLFDFFDSILFNHPYIKHQVISEEVLFFFFFACMFFNSCISCRPAFPLDPEEFEGTQPIYLTKCSRQKSLTWVIITDNPSITSPNSTLGFTHRNRHVRVDYYTDPFICACQVRQNAAGKWNSSSGFAEWLH